MQEKNLEVKGGGVFLVYNFVYVYECGSAMQSTLTCALLMVKIYNSKWNGIMRLIK